MYYLSSNFRQINDNFVTVKNAVARTTTISDIQKKSSIAQGLKEVLIHLNHWQTKALIIVTRWLMQIHPKHQIW